MILETTTAFVSPFADQTPAAAIANFFAKVAAQASAALNDNNPENTIVEFGAGAIELAFRVRDPASSATIPWDLVKRLALSFGVRASMGFATGFDAQLFGPLPADIIEVVLVVTGQEIMDGIPWGVY